MSFPSRKKFLMLICCQEPFNRCHSHRRRISNKAFVLLWLRDEYTIVSAQQQEHLKSLPFARISINSINSHSTHLYNNNILYSWHQNSLRRNSISATRIFPLARAARRIHHHVNLPILWRAHCAVWWHACLHEHRKLSSPAKMITYWMSHLI